MNISKNINMNFILIGVFIFLSIVIFFILKLEKENRLEEFLNQKTITNFQNYNVIYNHHKKVAQLIFDTRINTKETKEILSSIDTVGQDASRKLLYNYLLKEYKIFRKHNLKQLHFHLPNNESFLRFHRPNKFGDNLTTVRETVNYVNTHFKPIDGFEEGRIYNGYRFVYPLKKDNKYLGSVEISFSTLAMAMDLMESYNVIANFLISKEKVNQKLFKNEKKNYVDSPIPELYIEKKVFNYIQFLGHGQTKIKISEKTRKAIGSFLNKKEDNISIFAPELKNVITLIKVKNPVTKEAIGLFIIKSDATYVVNKTKNFYATLALSLLFVAMLLIFIKEEIKYRNQIKEDNKEIERLNGNLQNEIDEAVENLRIKETLLAQKSKMAAMGEMIDSIAHQWMQPISIIKLKLQVLEMDMDNSDPKKEKTIKTLDACYKQIQHLTDTIREFRAFFRPTEQKQTMTLKVLIDSALVLIKDELIKNTIEVKVTGDIDTTVEVTGNEFKHVIINLINNAKDAFIENDIQDRVITFNVESNGHIILTVTDTAGGIPENIINNIFEANFTTKGKDHGTGIGLYMSKQIVEKMNAKISVSNVEKGASFKIEIPNFCLI